MTKLSALLFIAFFSTAVQAQFYKSVLPSPEFSNALEKIVLDFRVNFASIQGNPLSTQGDVDTYESTVILPGASECLVYKYRSKVDTSASWQGIMYKGDNYKEACKVYENIFRLIKKSQVRWVDKTVVGFDGELEKPKESLRFTVSTLLFQLDDKRYKNFQADIELLSVYDAWEVRLNLQTRPLEAIVQ